MKIETFKEKLRWGVSVAERVTGKNLSLPALGFIKLEAGERSLVVKATNLDLGIEINVPAKVSVPGEVMLAGATVANFLSHLTRDDKVTLELVNNNLLIASAHTK